MNSQLPMQRVAITWLNHCGAALVKVVPFSTFDSAVQIGVGFSPVADAFCADGSVDASHSLARPDDDLRLRADGLNHQLVGLGRLASVGSDQVNPMPLINVIFVLSSNSCCIRQISL